MITKYNDFFWAVRIAAIIGLVLFLITKCYAGWFEVGFEGFHQEIEEKSRGSQTEEQAIQTVNSGKENRDNSKGRGRDNDNERGRGREDRVQNDPWWKDMS